MLASDSTSKRISLLFTSDEHGYITRQAKLQNEVVKARTANPDGTLLISCGDVFEGSSENGVLGLSASREMLDLAGYDLVTMGNHDFDRGAEVARDWINKMPCDVLVSNLKDSKTGELLDKTAASKVYELNGVKVGLIGVTTQETVSILPKAKLEGLSIEDPTAAVQAEVEKLKAQGIELIGLVSHLGLPTDRKMADSVPELDFILGGHTHDALEKPEQHGQTLIVHPGCFRKAIGHLDLDVNPATGQVTGVNYKLVAGEGQPDDAGAVGRLSETFKSDVDAAMGKVVANLPKEIEYDPNQLGEGMESLMARAVKAKTGADVVMVNQKGLRAGLKEGKVKVGDIYNVFPFDNQLVTLEMTAGEALKFYEESFRRGDQTSFALSDASMCFAVDRTTHQPVMVANAKSGGLREGFTPFMDSELYKQSQSQTGIVPNDYPVKVATLDFLVAGGLNYFEPGAQHITGEYGTIRDALQQEIQREYPVKG